jgi:hypothetical protein
MQLVGVVDKQPLQVGLQTWQLDPEVTVLIGQDVTQVLPDKYNPDEHSIQFAAEVVHLEQVESHVEQVFAV